MLVALADALTTTRQLTEARGALLAALAALPAEDVDRRLRLTAACAGVEQQLGLHAESHGRLVAALDDLTDRSSPPGVALMVALAADGFHQTKYDDLVARGEAAARAAAHVGERSLVAAAEAVLAMGQAFTGSTEAACAHAAAATAAVDDMEDGELAASVDALGHLTVAELVLERFDAGPCTPGAESPLPASPARTSPFRRCSRAWAPRAG